MSVLAQTTIPTSSPFDWEANLALLNGVKGASALGIAFVVTKIINNVVLAGWLDTWIGKHKLMIVSFVSVVISVIAMLIEGSFTMIQIVMHTFALTAFQVFLDQTKKQIFTTKGEV